MPSCPLLATPGATAIATTSRCGSCFARLVVFVFVSGLASMHARRPNHHQSLPHHAQSDAKQKNRSHLCIVHHRFRYNRRDLEFPLGRHVVGCRICAMFSPDTAVGWLLLLDLDVGPLVGRGSTGRPRPGCGLRGRAGASVVPGTCYWWVVRGPGGSQPRRKAYRS